MARTFDGTASNFLEVSSVPIAALPLTVGIWCYFNNVADRVPFSISDSTSSTPLIYMWTTSDGLMRTYSAFAQCQNTVTISTGTWTHMCSIWTDDMFGYVNGGDKVSTTSAASISGADRTSIGRRGDSSPSNYMDGLIAEVVAWNVVLTDDEVAAAASGVSQARIRSDKVVGWWPLDGLHSTAIDWSGNGMDMTVTGCARAAHHAPVEPYSLQWWGSDVSRVAAGGSTSRRRRDHRIAGSRRPKVW